MQLVMQVLAKNASFASQAKKASLLELPLEEQYGTAFDSCKGDKRYQKANDPNEGEYRP